MVTSLGFLVVLFLNFSKNDCTGSYKVNRMRGNANNFKLTVRCPFGTPQLLADRVDSSFELF